MKILIKLACVSKQRNAEKPATRKEHDRSQKAAGKESRAPQPMTLQKVGRKVKARGRKAKETIARSVIIRQAPPQEDHININAAETDTPASGGRYPSQSSFCH